MDNLLDEILKLNKLIKVLIEEENIDGIQNTLNEKNKLINTYNNRKSNEVDEKKFKSIKKLDEENIKNLKKLMTKTQDVIKELEKEKGQVKKKSQKFRKYNLPNSSSGFRFDRKK